MEDLDQFVLGSKKSFVPINFKQYYESIRNFKVREDDVYIAAFPKTGSRWTQEIVWLLLNNLDTNKAMQVPLEVRTAVLEFETMYANDVIEYTKAEDLVSPRCIKSHLPWWLLPEEITNGTKHPKIIVTLRCPEDTCTSYYHHAKVVEKLFASWEDFCKLFLEGTVIYGPYWTHLLSFLNQQRNPNILFVKFNQLKTDLSGTIRNIAKFLGKTISDEDISRLCEHLSFDNLKKSKGFNLESYINSKNGVVNPFIRKGIIGDHKNLMSVDVIKAFEKQKEQYLSKTKLSFD